MGGILVNESAYGSPNTAIGFSHKAIYTGISIAGDGVPGKAITVTGVLATDIVIVSFLVNSASRFVDTVVPAADTITVTASGNTAVTDYYSYIVFRAC
jgi:hypothetical protein